MKFSIRSNQVKVAVLTCSLFLTACSDSNSKPDAKIDGVYQAAIAGVSSDFGSSEISIANDSILDDINTAEDESLDSYDIANGYAAQDLSDITVASYGKSFYRLGRSSQNNITKYNYATPELIEWQFSVNDEGKTGSNTYSVIFVSETKAYVIRYGSDSILIIDPSVSFNDEENFKIGAIDLSAYTPVDHNVPSMSAAVLHKGKLYVTLQVLSTDSVPGEAKLAIIDTSTNSETTDSGITLNVKNPKELDIQDDFLYVSGVGRYENNWADPATPAEYTGGIEKINLTNLSSELIVDDGDDVLHPYGNINGLVLISESLGYFRGYAGASNESLYQFNPSSGDVEPEPITGFTGVDIRALSVSPNNKVWVGISGAVNPEIQVLDPVDNSLIATMYTNKIPSAIAFSGNLSE